MTAFDRYSVDTVDEMLAAGGRASPVRHDPTGHEDCAREWDPCTCHGDRLCQLGKLMTWARTSFEHAAWLRGEKEDSIGPTLLRMAGAKDEQELRMKARASERNALDMWRDAWPMLLRCANDQRAREASQTE